jgi:hypothetical protein
LLTLAAIVTRVLLGVTPLQAPSRFPGVIGDTVAVEDPPLAAFTGRFGELFFGGIVRALSAHPGREFVTGLVEVINEDHPCITAHISFFTAC